MQNITKIKKGMYEVRITYPDPLTSVRKEIRRRVKGTLTDARLARAEMLLQIAQGATVTLKPTEKPLQDYQDAWLEYRKPRLASSTYATERIYFLVHVMPDVKDWKPSAITAKHLDEVIAQWTTETKADGTRYSKASIRNRAGVLKRFLRWVFKQIDRDISVLSDMEIPQHIPYPELRETKALAGPEVAKFLAVTKAEYPQHYAIVFMLVATGQRWGSVSALRWQDVQGGWITFAQSHVKGVVRAGNKTGKVVRLPLTDQIKAVLEWHRMRMIKTKHPALSSELVFPSRSPDRYNGYQTPQYVRTAFKSICEKAGIEQITPHDLRRTFNSLQIEAGLDGTILRSITAHSSVAMTDHYYHGSRAAKESAISTVTNLIQLNIDG